MSENRCPQTIWNPVEDGWTCAADGFPCQGHPQAWANACPAAMDTRTPCPDCLEHQAARGPRLLRHPDLEHGLFCPLCGYRATPRTCARDLLRGIGIQL